MLIRDAMSSPQARQPATAHAIRAQTAMSVVIRALAPPPPHRAAMVAAHDVDGGAAMFAAYRALRYFCRDNPRLPR